MPRNSWVIPAVSNQETEIVTAESAEIETSKIVVADATIPLPVPVPSPAYFCVKEIPLETPPVLEASALSQESSDYSGIDKTLNLLFKAIQKRSGTVGEFKTDSNSLSCEKNNPLTEEKNDLKTAENASNENQFYQSDEVQEPNPPMISSPVEADLAADQPKPNEDLQENRSEFSITQTCLEFPDAISAKPAEEEIRFEDREEVNNLPPPKISNAIVLAITSSPIKLSKPKSALHLPKFPVTAAKSFLGFRHGSKVVNTLSSSYYSF